MKKLKQKIAIVGLALAGLTFIPLGNTLLNNHNTSSNLGAYQTALRANEDETTSEDSENKVYTYQDDEGTLTLEILDDSNVKLVAVQGENTMTGTFPYTIEGNLITVIASETNSMTFKLNDDYTLEEYIASEEGTTEETSSSSVLEDKDGNNIPDVIENYYNSHIRDQYMFGITLGSVISFAVSIIGWVAVYLKNTNLGKTLKKRYEEGTELTNNAISTMNTKLKEYEEVIKEKEKQLLEITEEYSKVASEYRELIEQTAKEFQEGVEVLKDYAKIDKKMDAILDIQKEFVANETDVINGTAEKVNKIVNEVK